MGALCHFMGGEWCSESFVPGLFMNAVRGAITPLNAALRAKTTAYFFPTTVHARPPPKGQPAYPPPPPPPWQAGPSYAAPIGLA